MSPTTNTEIAALIAEAMRSYVRRDVPFCSDGIFCRDGVACACADALARESLSALSQAGLVIVPEEPTKLMKELAAPWVETIRMAPDYETGARTIWLSMISSSRKDTGP